MFNWENSEVRCTEYLNDKFGCYAKFSHQGGTNSKVSDILVKPCSGDSFYIDVKCSHAQCGQFVLLPDLDNGIFKYSEKNANQINSYTTMIMNYMNQNFDVFKEVGTAGRDIDMPNGPEIFAGWIIKTYRAKGVKFFITNNYTIIPIDRFGEFFKVRAKYRIKRSGSGNIGKNRINSVTNYIKSCDYAITDSRIDEKKLFVSSSLDLRNRKFIFDGAEYMFAINNDEYELRKLANTHNANVIFSIHQKHIRGMSDEDFIEFLEQPYHKT